MKRQNVMRNKEKCQAETIQEKWRRDNARQRETRREDEKQDMTKRNKKSREETK